MKKFLVVLLSLGLILAFGMTASAADVKFSGSWYVVGLYENNQQISDKDHTYSRAFFYTRTRLQPVFQIAEGLTFTTRMDAIEKVVGDTNWRGGFDDKMSSRRQNASNTNPKIQESFEFERAYVTFKTAVGQIDAGYFSSGKWGTDFGDNEQTRPRIKLTAPIGPLTLLAVYEKQFEADQSKAGTAPNTYAHEVDKDNDNVVLAGVFSFKGGNTGLLYKYTMNNSGMVPVATAYKTKVHALIPFVKATFGPVYVEGELIYVFGKAAEFVSGVGDIDKKGLGAYVKARAKFGPAYAGGSILYSSGDDNTKDDKNEVGPESQDLDVGLILGNDALQTWTASDGNGGKYAAFDSGKTNALMFSAFGGFNPTPKTNVEMIIVKAQRDKVAAGWEKDLGWEFDIKASYKIYDNLTYMVGAGYLMAGDYFKGASQSNKIDNDYLLMNRLSLSF
ncbi:MAG: hypothetical protein M1418_11115 [Deltaproteobacteria bacterium]|nr:hypothetical protein [Deltaproteobacteria bacterium]